MSKAYFCPGCGNMDLSLMTVHPGGEGNPMSITGEPWACDACGYECNDFVRRIMPAFDDLDGRGMESSSWSDVNLGRVLRLYREWLEREGR